MLQDLEHRRSRPAGDASLSAQVRAVPSRRQLYPVRWIVGGLLVASLGVLAWIQLRPDAVEAAAKGSDAERLATVDTSTTLVPAPRVVATEKAPLALPAASESAASAVSAVSAAPAAQATAPAKSERSRLAELRAEEASTADDDLGYDTVPVTKEITAQQRTDNDYSKAVAMMQAGQSVEAVRLLGNVLQVDPGNAQARHTLIGLLVETRNFPEAERHLQEGLKLDPAQTGLAVILARLQVERGDNRTALQTLQRSLPHASGRADYLAFLAALLQREGRHKEAINYYLQALRTEPGSGVWLMGLGISLKADNRADEARDALGRALASNTLSPDLRAYVEQQLRN
jgi:MSHA biogenesis protein MshN